MERNPDTFIETIEQTVPLRGLRILEVGCGDGKRSAMLAERCSELVGVEPEAEKVALAKERNITNATFQVGTAERLDFPDDSFDLVIFTLSFHHVPNDQMDSAIAEAVRVVKASGYIVFLELTEVGSFVDAVSIFGIGEGDERDLFIAARKALVASNRITIVSETEDENWFRYDSVQDFIDVAHPVHNLDQVDQFLAKHNYEINHRRRITIAVPNK